MADLDSTSFSLGERTYADLVFHVLAHVESAVPASLYDPEYVAFAERYLGPADARSLGTDARLLREAAGDHARYARLQRLAWLFGTPSEAALVAHRDLTELSDSEVLDPALMRAFSGADHAMVEILRCAVDLERSLHEKLPKLELDRARLAELLKTLVVVAPALGELDVCVVRALGRRGRVRNQEIWVGAPFEPGGPPLTHLAWQAAHEATVSELLTDPRARGFAERALERVAVVLLGLRARAARLEGEHATWFAHFEGRAGLIDRACLNPAEQAWLDALLAR